MTLEPIEIMVIVPRPVDAAFDAFTQRLSDWWPLDTHSIGPSLGEAPPETVVVEAREGGRIFEDSDTGTERLWGRITAYEPGRALAFTWHPGLDEALSTHVTVRFEPTDTGATAVTLIHDGWAVRGENAEQVRTNYVNGWQDILANRFAAFAA